MPDDARARDQRERDQRERDRIIRRDRDHQAELARIRLIAGAKKAAEQEEKRRRDADPEARIGEIAANEDYRPKRHRLLPDSGTTYPSADLTFDPNDANQTIIEYVHPELADLTTFLVTRFGASEDGADLGVLWPSRYGPDLQVVRHDRIPPDWALVRIGGRSYPLSVCRYASGLLVLRWLDPRTWASLFP